MNIKPTKPFNAESVWQLATLPKIPRTLFILLICMLSIFLVSCTEYRVIKTFGLPVNKAQHEIPENQLLDIGIRIFDNEINDNDEQLDHKKVYADLRNAEAYYMAFELRKTLEESGQWGAVRTIPSDTVGIDVEVSGKIITSNGALLVLHIDVRDATGNIWLSREYSSEASKYAYQDQNVADRDPFQNIYNKITNDILNAKSELANNRLNAIRTVAELRFAEDLSPDAFGGFLQEFGSGTYTVNRLPATNDPMVDRIQLIRVQHNTIVDIFDQHYSNFHAKIRKPYRNWRKSSYHETIALKKTEAISERRIVSGGIAMASGVATLVLSGGTSINAMGSLISGVSNTSEGLTDDSTQIHVEAMHEISTSFNERIGPQVVELEGKAFVLEGSVQKQYNSWRQLLRNAYSKETGFSLDPMPIMDTNQSKSTNKM